jgi:hypothetical protein
MGAGCVGIGTIVSVGIAVDVGGIVGVDVGVIAGIDVTVTEGSIVADGNSEGEAKEVGVAESDTAGASVVTVFGRLLSIGKLQPASKINRGKLNFKACL